MGLFRKAVVLTAMLLGTMQLEAQVVLPPIFNCNMVLQKGIEIPVWGWASPGEKVTVTFENHTAVAKAGKDGKWSVKLPAMNYGGPYNMVIKGKNLRTIENIMIGEVWICSGQSNMEWPVASTKNADAEISAADYSDIRLFTVPKKIAQFPGQRLDEGEWWECSPVSVPSFSAVAYFFGRELYQKLKVPIGLINTSWGGTVAETWTSSETVAKDPDFAPMLDKLRKMDLNEYARLQKEELKARLGELPETDEGLVDGNALWAQISYDDQSWKSMNLPGYVEENGMSGFDGVVWFRKVFEVGENGAGKAAKINLAKIDDSDQVWINGTFVGGMENRYNDSRSYGIPEGVLKNGQNVVVIRMVDTGGNGGVYGDKSDLNIKIASTEIPLSGSWKYKIGKVSDVMTQLGPNDFPTLLYNGMIEPIVPYGIRGAIWYQGESNADRAEQYKRVFPNMINDWRNHWRQGDFPFLFVQLANFMRPSETPQESNWAKLREAQLQTLQLPETGMAVIIDAGEANDIHPRDKQTVGHRLALSAQKVAYKQELIYSGPTYKEMKTNGDKVVVLFENVGNSLKVKDKYGYVKGFAVAGNDKKFHWAIARITGENRIEIVSSEVKEPVAVRYAWADNPDDANLYNSDDLPASPFRTDNW